MQAVRNSILKFNRLKYHVGERIYSEHAILKSSNIGCAMGFVGGGTYTAHQVIQGNMILGGYHNPGIVPTTAVGCVGGGLVGFIAGPVLWCTAPITIPAFAIDNIVNNKKKDAEAYPS